MTPIQRWAQREDEVPTWEEVAAAFDLKKECTYVELLTLRRLHAANTKTSKK